MQVNMDQGPISMQVNPLDQGPISMQVNPDQGPVS